MSSWCCRVPRWFGQAGCGNSAYDCETVIFDGHAKRNEFTIDGRTLIGFGGTMMMETPGSYPAVAKQVIRELGIEADRAREFHHEKLYESLGVARGRVSRQDSLAR